MVPCRVIASLQRASCAFDGEADDAVPLPLAAPFRQGPAGGIVARGIEARAETADLAADQIFLAAVDRTQHDVGLPATHAGRKRMSDDLEADVIMRAQEGSQPRHQPVRRQRRSDRQLDRAACLAPAGGNGGLGPERGGCHRLCVLTQSAAIGGEHESISGTRQQLGPELRLQRRDLAADGRMAGVQPPRRGGEAAGIGHRDEGLAEVPIHRRLRSNLNRRMFNIERSPASRPTL